VKLNLGCGLDVLPGWVNIDASDQLDPSVEVWDLDEHPWPFEDASASEIRGVDIFEHVWNHTGFMVQCHRVLQPAGVLYLQTTWIESLDSFTDPDHTCHPTIHTFDYWVPGNVLYERQNITKGGVSFLKRRIGLNPETGQMDVWLVKPDA
jgi:hypothetical protein